MFVDFHMHSTASDGVLTPQQLLAHARTQQVHHLSITDHDSFAAYEQRTLWDEGDIRITVGAEFSTQWSGVGIHVLAYDCDPQAPCMQDLVKHQTQARRQRALRIAERLEKQGLHGVGEWLQQRGLERYIGRPDFARYLVESQQVKNIQQAFKKYLGAGKAGDVKQSWADLETVIEAIEQSGGLAVLAHPDKYKLTNSKLKRLLMHFKQLGGRGMEVVSGRQLPDRTEYLGRLCTQFELYASTGSDFHEPGKAWCELGRQSALPSQIARVETLFKATDED
jgi:predicted metal-dependent phosphoesterase TrpH